jgi:hypothetical protein
MPALPHRAKVALSRPRGGGSRPPRVAGSEPEAEQQCARGGERMRVPIRGGGNVSAPRGAGLPEAASNCLRVKVTGKKSSQHRGAAAPVFLQCGLPAALPRPVPTFTCSNSAGRRVRRAQLLFPLPVLAKPSCAWTGEGQGEGALLSRLSATPAPSPGALKRQQAIATAIPRAGLSPRGEAK